MSNLPHPEDAGKIPSQQRTLLGDLVGRHDAAAAPADPFRRLWDLGYRQLVPIIPPDAELSDKSHLKAALSRRDDRGKIPGRCGQDGRWFGFQEWQKRETTEADIVEWAGMGAGAGIVADAGLYIVDIDARDPRTAEFIEAAAIRILGPSPLRIGAPPKRALLYQGDTPATFQVVTFQGSLGEDRVEILARPRQIVAHGIHPKTKKPYEWVRPLVPRSELTSITRERLDTFLETIRAELPEARRKDAGLAIERTDVNQDRLKGDVELVRKAVAVLPNTRALFPSYDDMVRVGEAIHAATIDDPADGAEIFDEWASRWEGGDYDSGVTDARWSTFRAPHAVGADYLFNLSHKHSAGAFNIAERWHEPPSNVVSLFPEPAEPEAPPFDFASATRLDRARMDAIPERDFVLGSRFQAGTLTLGAGPAGVSKSTFAIKTALAIATGKPLTGETVAKSGPVLIYNAEDPRDEILRRIVATARLDSLDLDVVQDRVRILSGYDDRRLVFAERRERSGPVRAGDDLDRFAAFIHAEGIVHVALDPLVSLHRGLDENAASDMEALGDQLRRFASRTGVSVDLIHHTAKARGVQADANAGSADSARGSGAVVGFVRSAYTLVPMGAKFAQDLSLDPVRAAQMVRLDDAKRNYARRSARERWFEITSVLPSGEIVSASDFDSHDEAVRRRASKSAGVHVLFDINRQRALASIAKADGEDVQQMAKLQLLVTLMEKDEVPRAALAAPYGVALRLQGTQARAHIDALVPIGSRKAIEIEVDGYVWSVWREEQRGRTGMHWVVVRKRLGQIVRPEDGSEASDEANGGVFD